MIRKSNSYRCLIIRFLFFVLLSFLHYTNNQQFKELDIQTSNTIQQFNQLDIQQASLEQTLNGLVLQNLMTDELIPNNIKSGTIYTQEEFDMLCATVMAEVGYCSTYSQQLVTSVILNRVKSDKFPNTIKEVLTAKNQFTGIKNYYTNKISVTNELKQTVSNVLNSDINYANGSLYYYAPKYTNKKMSRWFENNLSFVTEYDGQRYFK